MAYSKKAEIPSGNGSGSKVDWDEFNEHLLEQIGEESEPRIAICSGIVDLGIQPRPDYEEKYKGSKEQDANIKSGRSYLSEDEKTIITPQQPKDQISIFADFPEIMINYGKFFSADGEDDWKPYRHLITGTYWDEKSKEMLAKGATLSCRPSDQTSSGYAFDGKSTISKIAILGGLSPSPVDQDFDVGKILGAVFIMNLHVEVKNGYTNVKATNIGGKHKMIPVPENDIVPFGVSWNGGNDDDSLQQVRVQQWNAIKRAINWDESGLKEDFLAYEKSKKATSDKDEDEEEKDEKPSKTKPEKVGAKKPTPKPKTTSKPKPKPKKVEVEEDEDEDDDCPFGDDD